VPAPSAIGQADGERDRHDRREDRKGWALYGLLVVVSFAVGWGMWRLDDRSERMFTLVAEQRRAAGGCP
jgi:hypothetical protein